MTSLARSRLVALGGCGVSMRYDVDRAPGAGETVMASDLMILNGGKAANQAIGAAKLGLESYLVSAVGDDVFSTFVLETMHNCGVRCEGIVRLSGSTTMTGAVIVETGGDNRIIVGPGALGRFNEASVLASADVIRQADVCLVSLEVPIEAAIVGLRIAREAGVRSFLNPSPAPSRSELLDLLKLSDVVVANEHEARIAVGGGDSQALAAGLLNAGARVAIVTLGERGALLAEEGEITEIPSVSLRPDQIVDTAGAGDAFLTALAVAVARGLPVKDAARVGAGAAARILKGPGFLEALTQWDGLDEEIERAASLS